MSLGIYLVFNGNCREALEFYSKVFNSEIELLTTFGDSPQQPGYEMPEEAKKLIMHARLNVSGDTIMFSDTFPGQPFTLGNNITLALVHSNKEDLQAWYEKLKDGGKVDVELQETFWSKLYGKVIDKFGVHWQLNYDGE